MDKKKEKKEDINKYYKRNIIDCLKKVNLFCFIKNLFGYAWKGNDVFSYLLFFFLAFVIYKFILTPFIFPLIFGTHIPFNTIVSESMEHNLPFEDWWGKYGFFYETMFNISKEQFSNFPFKDGLYIGDLVIVKGVDKEEIKVGDIIVFYVETLKKYIVHRVVKIKENGCFETLGDNNVRFLFINKDPQLFFEKNVCEIEGKVILRVPYLGYPKYLIYRILN